MMRDLQPLLADAIDAVLPQTQCGKCGYAGCRPYAEAMAAGAADINQCPPGGDEGIREIARVLGVRPKPLDPDFGAPQPPSVAFIEESICIGCTLCIQACPVDAIVGAPKLMHTVITAECTGCELCIPPCPVDCIRMAATGEVFDAPQRHARAAHFRARFEARRARLARTQKEKAEGPARRELPAAEEKKRAVIQRAMERAKQRLQTGKRN
ncbi:MAG TPA: RnfABCDGE type electron transport complex subunit B [Burkholderiales bacterium]|nr:RnfABCDGE type electron transport complex subunit B [Burkholderiales bacterium]